MLKLVFHRWQRLLTLALFGSLLSGPIQARPVTDALGQVHQVPDHPSRVVTLSEIDLDIALALGITPIGAVNGRGQSALPRYLAAAGGQKVPSIGALDNPNLELVLALEPDLILTGPLKPDQLALLNQIAPTLVTANWGAPWQETLHRVAGILNRQAEATSFMARYEARLAQARQQLAPHQGESLSIVRWNPKGPAYMHRDAFASRVIQQLGLVRPPQQQEPGHTHSPSLSLESLARLDGDWLVIGTLSTSGEAVDAMEQAAQSPAFRQMGAIQRGHYGRVDGSLWTSVGGPLAALQVIEDVEQLLSPR